MRRILIFATMFLCCPAQSSEIKDTYGLLVGCSVVYAKDHRNSSLTATELSIAAAASCERYANKIRDLHYENLLNTAMSGLTSRQQSMYRAEFEADAFDRAEKMKALVMERARAAVLQALAETPKQ